MYKGINKALNEGYSFDVSYDEEKKTFNASVYKGSETIEVDNKDFQTAVNELSSNYLGEEEKVDIDCAALAKLLKEGKRNFLYVSKSDCIKLLLDDYRIDGNEFFEVFSALVEDVKSGREEKYAKDNGLLEPLDQAD